MRARELARIVLLVCLAVSTALATGRVPRKSPDLIIAEPSVKQMRVSSFKGKVVLLEFMVTDCPHCLRVAQTIDKLGRELGPRGFQPLGVAFDSGVTEQTVKDFTRKFQVAYPIGYVTSEKVDSYLGRSATERFSVPQIVVIDRKGVIRAQSLPTAEKNLEDETYLRNLIVSLLDVRN
jgi:peroxiredoxin